LAEYKAAENADDGKNGFEMSEGLRCYVYAGLQKNKGKKVKKKGDEGRGIEDGRAHNRAPRNKGGGPKYTRAIQCLG